MANDGNGSKRGALTRRHFMSGAAVGATGAIVAREAVAQEFIDLGNIFDLPPNWWELPTTGSPPTTPPIEPPVTPVDPPPRPIDPPIPPARSVAIRRNVYSLNAGSREIAALRRGVQVMKNRSPDDPTSWAYQARIHGFNRGLGSPPFGAPWGTCRHASNDFLSWHRMYLHYFERILRAASGDPEFALPYWDYGVPGQSALPAPFRDPFNNPLFESRRRGSINGGAALNSLVTDSFTALQAVRFGRPFFSQALESRPHNVVHVEIGGAMGDPVTAGEDPIFWLHHCQIDRLWNRWVALGNGRRQPTDDPQFMNARYNFVDETGQFVSMTGAEVIDSESQLNYRYDDDPVAPVGINPDVAFMVATADTSARNAGFAATPRRRPDPSFSGLAAPALAAAVAAPEPMIMADQAFEVAEMALAEGNGVKLGGKRTGSRLQTIVAPQPAMSMSVADPSQPGIAALTIAPPPPDPVEAFMTDESAAATQPVILQLEGIEFNAPPGIWYAVYVNQPEGSAPDPRGPYFAGIFAPFAQNMSDEPDSIDITGLLNRQINGGLFDGEDIDVSFVPNEEIEGGPEVDIARIRIVRP